MAEVQQNLIRVWPRQDVVTQNEIHTAPSPLRPDTCSGDVSREFWPGAMVCRRCPRGAIPAFAQRRFSPLTALRPRERAGDNRAHCKDERAGCESFYD